MAGRTHFAGLLIVAVIGMLSALPTLLGAVTWTGTDALFYQAQSLELRGQSPVGARHTVLTGHPGRAALATDRRLYPRTGAQLASPRWRRYSARFYRRRWVVPALTALLAPVFGERSLLIVSTIGYLLLAPLIYLLLRRRFAPGISGVVAIILIVSWPIRHNALLPGTDSWGLALLLSALLAGLTVLEHGPRRLLLWFASLALLSLTREDGLVALVAAAWLTMRRRTSRAVGLLVTAIVATLPASLLLGASLPVSLAYVENNYNPPPSSSLTYVLGHYWPALRYTVHSDVTVPGVEGWSPPVAGLWYLTLLVVAAGIVALLRRRGEDPFFGLMRATIVGGIAYIAVSVNYTNLRLELVFVPAVAVGLALLGEAAVHHLAHGRRPGVWWTSPARSMSLS